MSKGFFIYKNVRESYSLGFRCSVCSELLECASMDLIRVKCVRRTAKGLDGKDS